VLVRRWILLASCIGLLPAVAPAGAQEVPTYDLRYEATIVPSERGARVSIRLGRGAERVRRLRFRIDPMRHRDFEGDGDVVVSENGTVLEWTPPGGGGALAYFFSIDHLRDERSYDSRCSSRWALFRGDDLVPPARVRTTAGAAAKARLRLRLPEGWSAAVPYPQRNDGTYEIDHPERRFDRPTGWFVLGDLGVVRENIGGVSLAIAGPAGHGLHRHDILAFLTWTLPSLQQAFGSVPRRLLVVGAGDPMWRGGLSGPNSVFIHADRPMITEDGTSPILHELVHALMRVVPAEGGDWIVEGFAEVYSLEALFRSNTIDERRYARARERLRERGRKGGPLHQERVTGATRARAATVLYELDAEIRDATEGGRSLDDVLRRLVASGERAWTGGLRGIAEGVAGRDLEAFFAALGDAPAGAAR
jgi:hypothetical protein